MSLCKRYFVVTKSNQVYSSLKQPLLIIVITLMLHLGYTASVDCPEGFEYKADRNLCEECGIGSYKPNSGDAACLPCPDGYVTMDTASTDISDCSVPLKDTGRCPAGSTWISLEERCDLCPVSTYRSGGSDYVCLPCPSDTSTSGPGSVSRIQCVGRCNIGNQWNIASESCEPCPIGSYSEAKDYQSCVKCSGSKQTTLQLGAGSKSACYQLDLLESPFVDGDCPLGTSWSEDVTTCVMCPLNTYRDTNSVQCTECLLDTYTIQPGATHKTLCMGTQQVQDITDLITPAEHNYFYCPIGMETIVRPPGCSPCPQGTYRDAKSQPHCQTCAKDNQEVCDKQHGDIGSGWSCPEGTEWHPNFQVCSICPVGTYKSVTSPAMCTKCPEGNTTWHAGATSEKACVIPLSDNEVAFFTKDQCPLGTEWHNSKQGCSSCPVSFYRDRTSRYCVQCSSSYTTPSRGSVSIYQCVVPLQPSVYTLTSDGCPPGMQPNLIEGLCKGCPLNTYKETAGLEACTDCSVDRSGQVSPTMSKFATSETDCHVDVLITEVSPAKVLMTGGTELTARLSTNASVIRIHSVFVNGVLCHHKNHLITNGRLECIVDHFREPGSGPMTVHVVHRDHAITTHTSSLNTEVLASPRVVQVSRSRFFLSGGVDLDIEVEDVTSVTNITALWYIGNRHGPTTECAASSSSTICKVPKMTDYLEVRDSNNRKRREANLNFKTMRDLEPVDSVAVFMGLSFDGWDFYQNLTDVVSTSSTLRFFNDPIVHNLPGHPDVVNTYISNTNLSVTFKGFHLSAGCLPHDYIIHIGQHICQVLELTDNHVICSLTEAQFASFQNAILYTTKVVIGNLIYSPGYVRAFYELSQTTIINAAVTESLNTVQQPNTSDNKKILQIVLPTVAALAVVVTLVVILLYMFLIHRRAKVPPGVGIQQQQPQKGASTQNCTWDPTLQNRAEGTPSGTWDPTLQDMGEIEQVNQAALPPLPVFSVFGPSRITDRGVTMRKLALPENIYSSGSVCS